MLHRQFHRLFVRGVRRITRPDGGGATSFPPHSSSATFYRSLGQTRTYFGSSLSTPPSVPKDKIVDIRDILPDDFDANKIPEGVVVGALAVTDFEMNQYVVGDRKSGVSAIIDSGGSDPVPEMIKEWCKEEGLELPTLLLQTHAHIDHIAGLASTKRHFPLATLYLHPRDDVFYAGVGQQSKMFGVTCEEPLPPIDVPLADGLDISLGSKHKFSVIETPGHSPGHVCFRLGDALLFGGDLIFRDSIGRTDLPLCSESDMAASLLKVMKHGNDFENEVLIMPGHNQLTTVGRERQSNGVAHALVAEVGMREKKTPPQKQQE